MNDSTPFPITTTTTTTTTTDFTTGEKHMRNGIIIIIAKNNFVDDVAKPFVSMMLMLQTVKIYRVLGYLLRGYT